MTVVGENSTIATQRPRRRPAQPVKGIRPVNGIDVADGISLVQEAPGVGLRDWTRELLECKHLLALSSVFVIVALFADYRCGTYVTAGTAVKVPDLILDRLPPVDLSFFFTYGYMALIVGMFLCPLFRRVRMLHVVAIQFSILLTLRSLFMIFTHVGTPAGAVTVHFPGIFSKLYFENDMFFSGHAALPFLGFYLFKQSPLRYVFLVGSIVMGIVVLAMHVHYSVDVFGAFFMTYCSYQMGNVVIRKLDSTYGDDEGVRGKTI
jgi:hypothetical protein